MGILKRTEVDNINKCLPFTNESIINDFKNKLGNTYFAVLNEVYFQRTKGNTVYAVNFTPICLKTKTLLKPEILHITYDGSGSYYNKYLLGIYEPSRGHEYNSNFVYKFKIKSTSLNWVNIFYHFIGEVEELTENDHKKLNPKLKKTKDKKLIESMEWMDFEKLVTQL